MSEPSGAAVSLLPFAIDRGKSTPKHMLDIMDLGVDSDTFRVFSSGRGGRKSGLVQTPAGHVWDVAADYLVTNGCLIPPSACIEILSRTVPEAQLSSAVSIVRRIDDLPFEPTDIPRLVRELKQLYKTAQVSVAIQLGIDDLDKLESIDSTVDELASRLASINESEESDDIITIGSVGDARVERMRLLRERPAESRGLTIGVPGFDRDTMGLFSEEMLLLAADEKAGKSSLLLYIADQFRQQNARVVLALKEMSTGNQLHRYECMRFSEIIDSSNLRDRMRGALLSDDEFTKFTEMWESIADEPGELHLIPSSLTPSIHHLGLILDRITRQHGQIDALCVDSAQSWSLGQRDALTSPPEQQRLMALEFLSLSSRHACPVIVDLQWRREVSASAGLSGIGLGKGWGEKCTYALRVDRGDGLVLNLTMIGSRESDDTNQYQMLFDPKRLSFAPMAQPRMDSDGS